MTNNHIQRVKEPIDASFSDNRRVYSILMVYKITLLIQILHINPKYNSKAITMADTSWLCTIRLVPPV